MKKLSQKIVKLLSKKRLNISFAESCTGGLLSSSITSISGSSKIFTIGLITYSNQAKIKILKVPKKIIMKHGAVSYYDKNFKNSFGVIMDDVCAGLYVVAVFVLYMVVT